jgi:starch-binding outer membrane protein, SusD/RagB family
MLATKINHTLFTGLTCLLFIPLLFSCRKLVEVDQPTQYVTSEATFESADGATTAVYGMYDQMRLLVVAGRTQGYDLSKLSAFYADEYTLTTTNESARALYQNAVGSEANASTALWNNLYQAVYRANAVLEGIEKYGKNIPDTLQQQFQGEARFVRAWAYFVLVNMYGDVPLLLTTDYTANTVPSRAPQADVYQQIISDLVSAKEGVRAYYVNSQNKPVTTMERVRANKDVVTAFLSKVYLYMGEWQKAEALASEVLAKTTTYSLNSNLAAAFDNSSLENILQVFETQYYATNQYDLTIANPSTTSSALRPGYISDSVMNKFEAGDKRRTDWIGTRTSGANTWYYPKKYKNIFPSTTAGQEYVAAMRVAELYLIRAEARIQQNQVATGIADLNTLRARARAAATTAVPNPLPALPITLSRNEAMLALEKEWTREMFMEGHRWFNLKRWKGINNPAISRADELMPAISAAKGGTWQPYKKLFAIPRTELEFNPNLEQNPGF